MTATNNSLLNVLPNDDILSQCIHCGMCLAVCPTYELTKLERSSPRGRIKLIKSVAEGTISLSNIFADEMNFCLDCQACETACPAGVNYGVMVEAARAEIDNSSHGSFITKFIKKFILKYIVANPQSLKAASKLLYFYQRSFFPKLLKKILPGKLAELDSLSPRVSKKFSDSIIEEITEPVGEKKMSTAFLYGCVMNVMFSDVNKDTVELLTKNGCRVITPKDQFCCGSLHTHNGDPETAKELAKKNLKAFSKHNYEYLASNSAGCGAFMKEYKYIFKDDEELKDIAENFSNKVKDLSEFFSDIIPIKPEDKHERVTYHDACHLVHSQKVFEQPRKIINSLHGIEYVELNEASWCCGSAGIYNITRFDDSMKILDRKIKNIKETGTEKVVTSNPGCITQLEYGLKKNKLNVKVEHLASFLNREKRKI